MSRALEGPRMMSKDIPSLVSSFDSLSGEWGVQNGWQLDNQTLYYESYYDLGGYELDDLTTLIDMIMLQDSGAYFLTAPGADSIVRVLDVVSEEKLSPDAVAQLSVNGEYPGTSQSTENYDQVKYCAVRGMIPQTDYTLQTLLGTAFAGSYGSSSPTTASKLWIYRIVLVGGTDLTGQVIAVPATRFIMGANVIKEEELPYMMRLKRSYELANNG